MRLGVSLALLGLAWFAAVNLAASVLAWLSSRVLLDWRRPSADVLALVRLAPSVLAAVFVLIVFVPGHLRLEPFESNESFGLVFVALTLVSVAVLFGSLRRMVTLALLAGRARRVLAARGSALRTPVERGETKTYELEAFAGLSLAGIFKGRILVGSPIRRALSPEELELAIAHECAHQSSRDNLTRCAMFCAPDLFGWSSTAGALEQRWRAETECRADSHAVAGDERRAVLLASALVKVAKLGGQASQLGSPAWSAFHEPALLETRVRRLLSGAALDSPARRLNISLALALLMVFAVVGSTLGAAQEIHHLTEALVQLLP